MQPSAGLPGFGAIPQLGVVSEQRSALSSKDVQHYSQAPFSATLNRMAPRPGEMTDEHKAALAEGRAQGSAVRAYLEALENHKPKRGRKRTPATIRARLATIDSNLETADPMSRLQMIQERMDLATELEAAERPVDLSALEDRFVAVAKAYSERKGISYAAWKEFGVPTPLLKRAGITRGS